MGKTRDSNLLGNFPGTCGVLFDLVMEDGVVESQSKSYGVAGSQTTGNLGGLVVEFLRLLHQFCKPPEVSNQVSNRFFKTITNHVY